MFNIKRSKLNAHRIINGRSWTLNLQRCKVNILRATDLNDIALL